MTERDTSPDRISEGGGAAADNPPGYTAAAPSFYRKGNRLYGPLTEEHKAKIRVALTGITVPEERKARIAASMTGRKLSAEHRANLSAAAKKRPPPVWDDGKRARASERMKAVWAAARAAR